MGISNLCCVAKSGHASLKWSLALAVVAVVTVLPAVAGAAGRSTIELSHGWKFHHGDVEAGESTKLDAAQWQNVTVPHDWGIAGPFDKSNPASGEGAFLPTGVGWYRTKIPAEALVEGKRVFIELDGVMANSDVWVNGSHLGHRPSGYVSLRYEITRHLRRGESEPNVIAVRADTQDQVASRWYTGSGIYRKVRLIVVDPLHIDESSLYVTTPVVSAEKAKVGVSLSVANQTSEAVSVVVETRVLNRLGESLASSESDVLVNANASADATATLEVANPQLWDVRDPNLYQVFSRVKRNGNTVDEVKTDFGIRTAEFRSDSGFWLNGRNLKIKGVCLHHDGGALGAAVPLELWRERLSKLQQLGVNAVRTAHNPPNPEFLDLCDRLGILVMDEFFDCWTVGKRTHDYHKHFKEWWKRDLQDTVRRDRNHPSVILYSVGNEIRDTPKTELAKKIIQDLVDACHEVDPTRPVTQGLFRPNASGDYDNGLADTLDVIGTNYRDGELLAAWKEDSTRKIIGTEQGHERRTWLACRDNAHHAGQFLWVGIDYLGESRRWPVTTYDSGLLDRTGYPHPRAYERQSWWSEKPMVRAFRRIAATEATPTDPGYEQVEWKRRQVLFDDWTPRDLTSHKELVEVYSNCEQVELLQNGVTLGTKPLAANASPRTWEVDFVPGQLVAIARNGGKEVARHELQTADLPRSIRLSSDLPMLATGWDGVAIVEAQVVDGNGTSVVRGEHNITFDVSGPGKVVAVDNGSIVSHEPFQASNRTTHQGRCVAVIKATGEGEEITITAQSKGLEGGILHIRLSH